MFFPQNNKPKETSYGILQLTTEKENTLCFDFLEEKIREESKKLIESI